MGRVAQSRQPMQIADLREDETYLDRHPLTVTAVELAGYGYVTPSGKPYSASAISSMLQ
jgi:hypothetical protein